MNLILAIVLAVLVVWLLGQIISLASLVLNQQFMNDYAREFGRIEAKRQDRKFLLDRIYGPRRSIFFLFTRRVVK